MPPCSLAEHLDSVLPPRPPPSDSRVSARARARPDPASRLLRPAPAPAPVPVPARVLPASRLPLRPPVIALAPSSSSSPSSSISVPPARAPRRRAGELRASRRRSERGPRRALRGRTAAVLPRPPPRLPERPHCPPSPPPRPTAGAVPSPGPPRPAGPRAVKKPSGPGAHRQDGRDAAREPAEGHRSLHGALHGAHPQVQGLHRRQPRPARRPARGHRLQAALEGDRLPHRRRPLRGVEDLGHRRQRVRRRHLRLRRELPRSPPALRGGCGAGPAHQGLRDRPAASSGSGLRAAGGELTGLERVAFCSTGSEAVLGATRLRARSPASRSSSPSPATTTASSTR